MHIFLFLVSLFIVSCSATQKFEHPGDSREKSPQKVGGTPTNSVPLSESHDDSFVPGGGSIAGGDLIDTYKDAAWFLGKTKVITYCLDVASNYPITEDIIEPEIETAFIIWQQYIEGNNIDINPRIENDIKYHQITKDMRFTFNRRRLSGCNGSEDLIFKFGIDTGEIRELKKRLSSPFGFAYRAQYDKDTNWGRGLIWIASPDQFGAGSIKNAFSRLMSVDYETSRLPVQVLNDRTGDEVRKHYEGSQEYLRKFVSIMLIHELGHVFGNGHVEGTIMESSAENLVWKVINDSYRTPYIDEEAELYPCVAESFFSRISPLRCKKNRYRMYALPNEIKGVSELIGVPPQAETEAFLTLNNPESLLTIRNLDRVKQYTLPTTQTGNLESYSSTRRCNTAGERIFYRATREKNGGKNYDTCLITPRSKGTLYSRLTQDNGKTVVIALEFDRELNLRYFMNGSWNKLAFRGVPEKNISSDWRSAGSNLLRSMQDFVEQIWEQRQSKDGQNYSSFWEAKALYEEVVKEILGLTNIVEEEPIKIGKLCQNLKSPFSGLKLEYEKLNSQFSPQVVSSWGSFERSHRAFCFSVVNWANEIGDKFYRADVHHHPEVSNDIFSIENVKKRE